MSRATSLLPTLLPSTLLIVLLAGCAAHGARCDRRLRPINIAASAPALTSWKRAGHE